MFIAVKSMEGMYSKTSKTILISSLRPTGRKNYTCGHELGHWYFNHGNCIDQVVENDNCDESTQQERLVNLFSGYLLMPKWAVNNEAQKRNFIFSSINPIQIYMLANQLGVGYSTLVNHMRWTLKAISNNQYSKLIRYHPKELRSEIIGENCPSNLIIVDLNWSTVAVDLQVEESVILPKKTKIEGTSLKFIKEIRSGSLMVAKSPGIARAESGNWSTYVRVSKKEFAGRSIYRHMEVEDG